MKKVVSTAVILAGGLGVRLRSVVSDRPKSMADVGGKPFIAYLVDRLSRHGISNIVICVGYMKKKITDYFEASSNPIIRFVSEDAPLGTAGALKNAARFLPTTFLVLNGDTFLPIDYRDLAGFHLLQQAEVTIALARSPGERFGRVALRGSRVVSFFEKTGKSTWANGGVYVVERSVLDLIPKGGVYSLENDFFPSLLRSNRRLFGYKCSVPFVDIGTPESYLHLRQNPSLLGEEA